MEYRFSDGSAELNNDYTASDGVINFSDGETSQTITIDIIDDSEIEDSESFTLTLSNPITASLGDLNSTIITIEDNDNGETIEETETETETDSEAVDEVSVEQEDTESSSGGSISSGFLLLFLLLLTVKVLSLTIKSRKI